MASVSLRTVYVRHDLVQDMQATRPSFDLGVWPSFAALIDDYATFLSRMDRATPLDALTADARGFEVRAAEGVTMTILYCEPPGSLAIYDVAFDAA